MSSPAELVDVLSRVANIFLKAVDTLEGRMYQIEQRIDDIERALVDLKTSGSPSAGRREPTDTRGVLPAIAMESQSRRSPTPVSPPTMAPPPQQTQRADAYSSPQPQWGAPRQEPYSQPAAPSYQARPPTQPQGYQPHAYQQQPPQQASQQGYLSPPPQQAQQQAPPAAPTSPLNIRQAVTGELKEIFARMRARAEGR